MMTMRMRLAAPLDKIMRRASGARRLGSVLLLLAAFTLVTACSGFTSKISRRFGGKVSFTAELDSRLNQDFPLAIDFVIIYDKDLLDELGKLGARDWFAQRDQSKADNEPERLEVHSWEWVPPCAACPVPGVEVVDHRLGAHGGIVFADYFAPGMHRVLIEPLDSFTLQLGESEFELGPPPSRKQTKADAKNAKADKKAAKKAAKKRARAAKKAKKAARAEGDS